MWKDSVAGYVKNGLLNCYRLSEQLFLGTYKIDKYVIFTIYEPKKREIVATRMKDRIFQRSLCDNYLTEEMTKSFIYDNCACQINKGTDFAMRRLGRHMQRQFKKDGPGGYVLKADMKNFFGSTSHELAKRIVRKYIQSTWATNHVDAIIDSFNQGPDPNVGMGLGSQVTQLIQLAVLNELDHEIKELLRIKHYVRYMDDLVLVHKDKQYLRECLAHIEQHVNGLGLALNRNKTQIFPLKQGIKFLGFSFHLNKTGGIIKLIDRNNVTKRKRKINRMIRLQEQGRLSKEHIDRSYGSWKAHAKRGNTYRLIMSMDRVYESFWREAN